ncbi:MAG: hypothetical protein IJ917_07340 [Firmicutes bacterium]|nr:hypothetical protein [Bacillota bacterium]
MFLQVSGIRDVPGPNFRHLKKNPMTWYLCLILAIICMAASVCTLFDRKRGRLRAGIAVLLMALSVLIIYVPIFFKLFDFPTALFGDVIHMLQVITLDAGYTEFYRDVLEGVRSPFMVRVYMTMLGLLHFAMPAVSILAAYNIFIHYYAFLRIWLINHKKRPLFIFSDCNQDSMALAKSIRANVRSCDLIFADRKDTEDHKEKIDSLYAVLYAASIQDLPISRRKDKDVYYFCMEKDDEDLNNALHLVERYEKRDKTIQKHTHIYVMTEQKDVDIMLDSTNKGLIDIHVVNVPERTAYRLLDEHPLYEHIRDGRITVLLAGLTPVNIALLKAICWCGQMGAFARPKIYAAGIRSEAVERSLRVDVPELFAGGFDITMFHAVDLFDLYQQIEAKAGDAGYVSVAMGDDSQTLDTACWLRRMFYRVDDTFTNAPPIFTLIQDHEKKSMVEQMKTPHTNPDKRVSYQLTPFGARPGILSYENLVHEPLEQLAKNVHMVYSSIFSENGEIDVEKELENYNRLEVNKRSNRANAMHIRYKLALIGLDYTDRPDAQEVDLSAYLTPERMEVMQRAEHDRWMAFLQTEGWIGASPEQVGSYRTAGLAPGSHKCDLMKMHPYIRDFEGLSELSETLEGKDTTVYDRDLIMRIPDILHDRWNISDIKYKIIKR